VQNFLVGTGGWAYFKVGSQPSLRTYSEIFNFVEVNHTFYEYPKMEIVENWRRSVANDFTFSVRCHQDLTHKIGLRPLDQAYEIFYQMKAYCDALHTPYLVLETPKTYTINEANLKDAKDFFACLKLKGVRLVWEYRAPKTPTVTSFIQEHKIIPCVDLSREQPPLASDVTYSRLFGKGQHNLYQFSDDELTEIDKASQDTGAKTIILSYHGARMHSDAARFMRYKSTGTFLPITNYLGVESAKAVLAEDANFPASKAKLEDEQGWKVFDLTSDRRIHLSEALAKIPDKKYSSLNEVVSELRSVL
jgi:uncharacterized protein YecE (DUF72 family)